MLDSGANLVEVFGVQVEQTLESNIRALAWNELYGEPHRARRQVAVQTLCDDLAIGGILGKHLAGILDAFDQGEIAHIVADLNVEPFPHKEVTQLSPLETGFDHSEPWNFSG